MCLIGKCFDWLRIFDRTAFFIRLIEETFIDIAPFMILFTVSLAMFAMPLMVLNAVNHKREEDPLMDDMTGIGALDAILSQYYAVLDSFQPSSYTEQPVLSAYTCILFVCAASCTGKRRAFAHLFDLDMSGVFDKELVHAATRKLGRGLQVKPEADVLNVKQ